MESFDYGIKYKKDIAPILELIDKLTPWDRNELIAYLWDSLDGESVAELASYFGYVNYDNIDIVQEVIDSNKETEVLDSMYTSEIIDYLFNGWGTGWSSLDESDVKDVLRHFSGEEIGEYIQENRVSDLLDSICKNKKKSLINGYVKKLKVRVNPHFFTLIQFF